MSQRTALPLFISDSVTRRRHSAGLKKVIRIAPVMTLFTLESNRCSTHCAAIRASRNLSEKFWRRRTDRRHESKELLRRAEAAQRLQGCDRLCSRGLAADAGRESDFSVLRNSELGRASGGVAARYRISCGDDSCLGLRANTRRNP